MKKHTKAAVLMMSAVMAFGVAGGLAGCGSKGPDTSPDVLNIRMPDHGYGTDWMKALANGFKAKYGNEVNVSIIPPGVNIAVEIRSGTSGYDIYAERYAAHQMVAQQVDLGGGNVIDKILADLTDLYETEIPGEDVTFGEKLLPTYEQANRFREPNGDVGYYGVQWCDSTAGIVRNLDVWEEGWGIPNTTDELVALCDTIQKGGKTPFIWSSQASYWDSTRTLWAYQYQGYDDMMKFWECLDANDEFSPLMWQREGWLEALKVMDVLLDPANAYQHAVSRSVDFTTAQGYILAPSQKVAMMANGDWLYKEMAKNYSSARIEMIKTPVISAIIDVLPDKSVADDAELSALIKAIDAGSPALSGTGYLVTQDDFDRVKEARLMSPSVNINHQLIVPSYSTSIELAKKFMLYMASEEGLKLYASIDGFSLPFKASADVRAVLDSKANSFVKSTNAIKLDGIMVPTYNPSHRMFSVGGMPYKPTYQLPSSEPELILCLKGETGYMSPQTIYDTNYQNVFNQWGAIRARAGV